MKTDNQQEMRQLLKRLTQPRKESHKGQNGKLLVIGGSSLFHASLIWSAEVASRIVDMVHVCSPAAENNQLMQNRLKERFWNGIVVPWEHVDDYIEEDDCVLIGPGMVREEGWMGEGDETKSIVDRLLKRYPKKQWVVDGGALQEVNPSLLTESMVITPHKREWERIKHKELNIKQQDVLGELSSFSVKHHGVTILLKGPTDVIVQHKETMQIEGGNEGMTKGGSGDVLAGLVASLMTTNDPWLATLGASAINKLTGDHLYQKVGPYYNASDLLAAIPELLFAYTR